MTVQQRHGLGKTADAACQPLMHYVRTDLNFDHYLR